MSINTTISDEIIDHSAMVRLYEDKLAQQIDNIYSDHKEELLESIAKGKGTRDIVRRVRKQVAKTVKRSTDMLSTELRAFISMEGDFASDVLEKNVGEIWRVKNTPKTALRNIIGSEPIRQGGVLTKQLQRIGQGEIHRVSSLIRRSIANGDTVEDIVTALGKSGALRITKAQTNTLVRTAMTQYSSTARRLTFLENSDVISGYTYVATLDSRTSQVCARNDGRKFKLTDGNAPRPPLHWNCRSTTTPIVKGYDDIDPSDDRVKSRAYNNASPLTRASFNGQVPIQEDYGAWLKRQPYETQYRHLQSDKRIQLFINGSLKLSQFSNSQGKLLTIQALRRLDARATNRLTLADELSTVVCRSPCKDFRNKEDFQIATKNSEITKTSDFYDGPDANEAHFAFIDFTTYHSKSDGLQFSSYKGNTQKARAKSYGNTVNDPENIYYNTATDTWQHASEVNVEGLHTILARVRKNIADDVDLTIGDKDYLLGKFDARLQEQVQGPAHAASLSAALRSFRVLRRGNFKPGKETFQDVFLRNLYTKMSGAADDIARQLRAQDTGLTFLQKIDRNELSIQGRRKSATIDDIVESYDEHLAVRKSYKVDEDIVDDVFDTFNNSNDPLASVVTKADIDDIIRQAFVADELPGDLDQFRVNLGRMLWMKRGKQISPLEVPATTADYHKTGAAVIKGLSDNKYIDVRIRTYKKVLENDPLYSDSGPSRYYTQSYFQTAHPSLHRIRESIGYINKRNRVGYADGSLLEARAGDVYFRNKATGELTDIPMHTSNLTDDAFKIDKKQADILNAELNREVYIDKDGYAAYLEKSLSTPRGSNINVDDAVKTVSQKELAQRNDFELLTTLRYYLRDDTPDSFSSLSQLHQSSRSQYIGILTPGSGEYWRPALTSPNLVPVGKTGWDTLTSRFAVVLDKSMYNSVGKRTEWFKQNQQAIYDYGKMIDDVIKKGQTKSRLIKIDNHKFTLEFDEGADLHQFQRMALETYKALNHANNGRKITNVAKNLTNNKFLERLYTYESRVVIELDAAESGQGIIAAITKNKESAKLTNLISSGENRRLRSKVAEALLNDKAFKQQYPFLTQSVLEKIGKDQITTSGYGSGEWAILQRIIGDHTSPDNTLRKAFEANNFVVLSKSQVGRITKAIDKLKDGQGVGDLVLSKYDTDTLTKLRKNLRYTSVNTKTLADDLYSIGRHFDAESKDTIRLFQESNLITRNQLSRIADMFYAELNKLLPGRERYFNFSSSMFESYAQAQAMKNILDGRIPVLSFDGRQTTLVYKARERYKDRYIDEDGSEVLINVVSEQPAQLDLASLRRAAPVEFIFLQDAGIAGRHAVRGRNNIYDGFEDNIGNLDTLVDDNLQAYADLVDSNALLKQLDLLKSEGLPIDDFIDATGKTRPGYNTLKADLDDLLGDLQGSDILNQDEISYLID